MMRDFLLRAAMAAAGVWLAAEIVPGIEARSGGMIVLAALLLGVVNATLRPIAVVLSLPLTLLTLGLFLLVVNAAMLGLVAWLLPGFAVSGFWSALAGAVIVSLVSAALNRALREGR
jgi:putative membrane protein